MLKKIIGAALALSIIIVLAGCAAGGGGATPGGAAAPGGAAGAGGGGAATQLRLSHNAPDGHVYDQAAHMFAELVYERTSGRYEIIIFPNNQLGSPVEVAEAVMLGNIDFTITSDDMLVAYAPEFGALGMPFLFDDFDHVYNTVNGPVGEYLDGLLRQSGIAIAGWFENGFRHITNSRGPIYTPDDIAGLRMRVLTSPPAIDFMDEAGASVISIAIGELYIALQLGTADAQENPLHNIRDRGFYEVQDYLSMIGYMHTVQPLIMSMATYNRMSPEDREIIMAAGREASTFSFEIAERVDAENLEYLRGQMNVNEADRESFMVLADLIWERNREEFGRIIDMIRE